MTDATPADTSADIHDMRLRRWATYASVSVAVTLMCAKLGGYLFTDSVALLSSLIDSGADIIASALTLFSVSHAMRPPDLSHRYGHGKAESLAALAQAAFVGGSALFLSYEAIGRLIQPRAIEDNTLGIGVMVLSITLTGLLVLFQHHVIRRTNSLAIDADSLNYRGDLLTNLAIILALALTEITGWIYIDPLFALAVAGFMIVNARRIALGSLDVLMDHELPADDRARIETIIRAHAAVRGLHDLRTRSAGTAVFVDLHLELDPALTLAEAHDITDEIEARLRAAFPIIEISIHQEPEGLEDDRLDTRLMNGGARSEA